MNNNIKFYLKYFIFIWNYFHTSSHYYLFCETKSNLIGHLVIIRLFYHRHPALFFRTIYTFIQKAVIKLRAFYCRCDAFWILNTIFEAFKAIVKIRFWQLNLSIISCQSVAVKLFINHHIILSYKLWILFDFQWQSIYRLFKLKKSRLLYA